MFFNLSNTQSPHFLNNIVLPNGLHLSTDDGWHTMVFGNTTVIIKGYADNIPLCTVAEKCITSDAPNIRGNFTAFVCTDEIVRILHDMNRGYPLWINNIGITNLHGGTEQIWADCLLTVDKDMNVERSWFNPFSTVDENISDTQIVDKIHDILMSSFENFLSHNELPLKIFLSGGIDTTTMWAYLDHFTKDYELVDYEYMKLTPFYKRNQYAIKRYWGYTQIHLWEEPCVLITGGNGDENMLRGPNTLSMKLHSLGLTFADILQPDDYHYTYFMKKQNIFDTFKNLEEIYDDEILNININDHQHWHLENTITFTPCKNIDILSLVLSGSKELIVAQARDAWINKELIKKLDKTKLRVLSNQKNINCLENT